MTIEYNHHSLHTDPYMAIIEAIYVKRGVHYDTIDEPVSITVHPSDNPLYQYRIEITVTNLRRT